MQQGLALAAAAGQVAGGAEFLYLSGVAADVLPAGDLTSVFVRDASPHVVAAIPLKPAPRVVWVNPTFCLPLFAALTGAYLKEVAAWVVGWRQLGVCEPFGWVFVALFIFKIVAAKHTEFEHLPRGEIGCEIRGEVVPLGCRQCIAVLLQRIVHANRFHKTLL